MPKHLSWRVLILLGVLIVIACLVYQKYGRREERILTPSARSIALKNTQTFLYAGPGGHYPKLWVFQRRGLPLKKLEQREHWIKVQDPEGSEGWVHQTKIRTQASGIIQNAKGCRLYRSPQLDKKPIAHLEKGICVFLRKETKDWIQVQVSKSSNREGLSPKGWILKKDVWFVENQATL